MNRPILASLLLIAGVACNAAEDPQLEQVRKKLTTALPGIDRQNVQPSPAPGLYQVQKGQSYGYVTSDGRYLIQGDMVDLTTGEEVTEKQRMSARVSVLKQFGSDRTIDFLPKDPKYVVTVFTDIDCGYCRKLHAEMDQYHARGIGVRYLFYPRSGPRTPSFTKAEQVWCSSDKREAMTQAKRGAPLTAASSCSNPVQKQWEAGEALGINATPMIVLPDGELVRGYVPAAMLATRLSSGDWQKAAAAR